jgi:hypothetical protein
MSTYKALVGKKIKSVSSDPTDSIDGQMWYNTGTQSLRALATLEAWSSGTTGITGRDSAASTGPQTNALVHGGANPSRSTATEEYNGTGWSTGGALPTATTGMGSARNASGTAALGAGGYDGAKTAASYTYNGTSWTGIPSLGTARQLYMVGGGTSTAAIVFGGDTYPPVPGRHSTATEEWDGSSWTAGGSLGTGGYSGAGTGLQTAAVRMGAPSTSNNTVTENYDGSTWSTSGTIPVSKSAHTATGTQTSALMFAGIPAPVATTTLSYDGSVYAAAPSMAISKYNVGSGGTSILSFASHGRTPSPAFVATTEHFTSSTNVITAAAWSSGGNLNTGRELGGNAGTSTAGLLMSGKVYPNTFKNETEEYNGSSWSEQNNVSTARATSGAGTQTAGIIFGGTNGAPGSTGVQTATEEYDGSSWTNGGALSTARMGMYGAGLQTACFGAGGTNSSNSPVTTVEDYNGSSWTSGTAIPTAQQGGGGAGLPSARLVFAGYAPYANFTVEGDGEGWTAGGNMIDARGQLAGFGSQTDAFACAGSTSAPNVDTTAVEGYDGTSWSTRPSLSTERMGLSPGGAYNTTTGGMVVGGSNSGNPMRNQTEEWNPETTADNIKTFSTS